VEVESERCPVFESQRERVSLAAEFDVGIAMANRMVR
jgi:hypothetical protein